jgi:DNA-binding response OmpR family regulator
MAAPAMQKILVAVANEDLANLLKRGLEVENYLVERAQDGREALQRAMTNASSYQLLVLDALLEHKSGFDICREMRKSKRETPVILLGGRQGVEDKIEALQSGADDFLSKRNLVFEELMAKIEALLR